MTIRNLRLESKMTQRAFATYFNVPIKTLESWDAGTREPSDYVVELIEYKLRSEIPHMKDYNGARWGCLNEEDKQYLLTDPCPVDGITANEPKESGECIIDLVYPFSVIGYFEIGENEDTIDIEDNAIVYTLENDLS